MDVSQLLAAYLKDEDFGEFCLVSGWLQDGSISHAWLEKNSITIDLTADQFYFGAALPLVAINSAWHSQFTLNRECREDGDFRYAGEPIHLSCAYAKLQPHLH